MPTARAPRKTMTGLMFGFQKLFMLYSKIFLRSTLRLDLLQNSKACSFSDSCQLSQKQSRKPNWRQCVELVNGRKSYKFWSFKRVETYLALSTHTTVESSSLSLGSCQLVCRLQLRINIWYFCQSCHCYLLWSGGGEGTCGWYNGKWTWWTALCSSWTKKKAKNEKNQQHLYFNPPDVKGEGEEDPYWGTDEHCKEDKHHLGQEHHRHHQHHNHHHHHHHHHHRLQIRGRWASQRWQTPPR